MSVGPAGGVSPYAAEYQNLQVQDAAELMQVSLGSPGAAAANVDSVLAQAAALQNAQVAQQRQQSAAAAVAAIQGVPASTPGVTAGVLDQPSLQSVENASESAALSRIDAFVNGGSSIDLLA